MFSKLTKGLIRKMQLPSRNLVQVAKLSFSVEPPKPEEPEKLTPEEFISEHLRSIEEQRSLDDKKGAQDPTRGSFYIFGFAGVALLTLFAIQKLNEYRDTAIKTKKKFSQQHVGKPDIGGDWEILDTQGKPFGSADLRNSYYVIYFGFCNCPDICPASLSKLAKAFSIIQESKEKRLFDLKLVFVSVDPDRDTLPKIDQFAKYFHPTIIGVTGKSNDDPKLKEMLRKFKIYATKMEFETTNEKGEVEQGYTYDHSVIAYLMSDENEYLVHLGSSLGSRDLANNITDHIMARNSDSIRADKTKKKDNSHKPRNLETLNNSIIKTIVRELIG